MFDEIERIGFWYDIKTLKNEIKEEIVNIEIKVDEDVEIVENIK